MLTTSPNVSRVAPSVRCRRWHGACVRRRWLVRSLDGREGRVPARLLEPAYDGAEEDDADAEADASAALGTDAAQQRRERNKTTEEEFARDLRRVVEQYLRPLDSAATPRAVRDAKDVVFSNLKQIADFHSTVLIEGVKYYASEPHLLGKTFLRLERDFDKHVAYCRDEPAAQSLLLENDAVREYFEEFLIYGRTPYGQSFDSPQISKEDGRL
ncbi:Uncharacterized protein GBIM_00882 [Gryllus bimaculatus]|nr:Uncharacterized protein GBIM_00882 [Gryllus bimaculatus]